MLVIGGAILASANLWGAGEPLMEASVGGVFGDGLGDAGPDGAPGGRATGLKIGAGDGNHGT